MKCFECQAPNPEGQKFCGSCGFSMGMDFTITIARSGLITHIDQKAADMLGYPPGELQGRPFTLFVENEDLVIFFSNFNDVLNKTERKSFDIALKHKNKKNVHAQLLLRTDPAEKKPVETIYISLTDITDSHMAATQMQAQQDLLGLVFTITNDINTINSEHLDRSIEDALKKICLFTKAHRCFIYIINRPSFRLDPLYEWRQPIAPLPGMKVKSKSVSLSKIKQTMETLRSDKKIIIDDIAGLKSSERDELLGWHHVDLKSLLCHLIYLEKQPIGVIGVARNSANGAWEPYSDSLVSFFGDLIAKHLSLSDSHGKMADRTQPDISGLEKAKKKLRAYVLEHMVDMSDLDPDLHEELLNEPVPSGNDISKEEGQELIRSTQPMVLSKPSDTQPEIHQSVYQRTDGMVELTCPHCGTQEPVSIGKFTPLGIAIRVSCPCSHEFNVMLEKRRSYRKLVELEGYFSLSGDVGPDAAGNSIWGPMIIQDLSKTGLQFSSSRANLLQPGNLLLLRFNLDNENKALIHKQARVISIEGNDVRCQFEGADSYDITLGFYFM
jgi:hypothetical protein